METLSPLISNVNPSPPNNRNVERDIPQTAWLTNVKLPTFFQEHKSAIVGLLVVVGIVCLMKRG